jgi:hypothetical protein
MADWPEALLWAADASCPGKTDCVIHAMLSAERRTNLAPDFAATRAAAALSDGPARQARMLGPVTRALAQDPPAEPVFDPAAEERKQALAANLESMIGGMLQTAQFATAAKSKARDWGRQIGEVAALDASIDSNAFTANSLVADLAQARVGAPAAVVRQEAAPRRWIDAVLVLAGVLSILSAGYFTFAP